MDTSDFNPDAFLAENAATDAPTPAAPTAIPGESAPSHVGPTSSGLDTSTFDPDEFLKEASAEKYGTGEQMFKTALEGVAEGLIGPLAPLIETKVFGVKPEDIVARKEENPWVHGIGEAAGLVSPVGEGALLAKVAGKVVPALGIGSKIGANVAKGAIEAGLFQGGDEISNALLGQADPEAPVAAALAHMGAAGLFGAGIGGVFGAGSAALKKLGDTKLGSKMNQMAEDFGSRWKYNQENPDLFNAVKNEITDFHAATSAAADEVYGVNGLKQQAIDKLVPAMGEAIDKQNQTIADRLASKAEEMLKNPDAYPPRLANKFQNMANKWQESITTPGVTSQQVFGATQELKQELQAFAKFDKRVTAIDPGADFIKTAKELSHYLRVSLEDSKVWGKAADLQKNINKAFVDFLPAQKDFINKFMTKVEGEYVIDPGKIQTYVNQLGKSNAEIKQQMMENYIKSAENYRSKIADLHEAVGVESPIPASSLDAVRGTFGGTQSPGAKLADYVFNKLPSAVGGGIAGSIGTTIGAVTGGGGGAAAGAILTSKLAPYFQEMLGRPVSEHAASTILKALSSDSAKSIAHALDHAANVKSGAQKINRAVEGIFKASGQQVIDAVVSDKQRERVKKYIKNNGLDQQMQDYAHPLEKLTPKKFAEGGQVNVIEPIKTKSEPSKLADTYPEQDTMMNVAKSRVFNYLSQTQPNQNTGLPFDRPISDASKERAYDEAVDLSIQPLTILNHIKAGTLTADHVGHVASMYPELKSQLDKKITEQIVKSQMDEEKPPYSTRMSLSLFLGTPLDSTMTPANILAAQPKPKAPQASGQAKGNPSKVSPKQANSYKTPGQAAESDRSNRD